MAILNNAYRNTLVLFGVDTFSFHLGEIPKSEIGGLNDKCVFSFLSNCKTSKSPVLFCIPTNNDCEFLLLQLGVAIVILSFSSGFILSHCSFSLSLWGFFCL